VHPRNRFKDRYDFRRLVAAVPELAECVTPTGHGADSINFANSAAVLALNRALIVDAYGLQWSVPAGALCPGIPGRSDYIHYLADLLSNGDDAAIPRGAAVRILDIGTGASAIFPIIGAAEYGWSFVGTEMDPASHRWARQIVRVNRQIAGLIEMRMQPDVAAVFKNVTSSRETFSASMCNPPFHASAAEAAAGTLRKQRNLKIPRAERALNFGGRAGELWCEGGERGFIERMIIESASRPRLCRWFTTLVSQSAHLPPLRRLLKQAEAREVRVIEMVQGQKKSRMLAWAY
jgi:23S rRNA (adenine1618-N6)-methyltransferase